MKGFGRLKLLLGILIFLVSVNAVAAACPDFDKDDSVGFNDFFLFSQYFNWQVNETTKVYDVDGNNAIDLDDFFLFSAAFGKKCGELAQAAAQAAETPQTEQPAAVVLPKPDACQQNIEACKKQVSYILAAGSKVAKLEDGKLQYYHSDHLGSVSKITDDSGSVVFSADYLPFGEQIRKEGKEKFTYTGKELDEESGLYYYGARYYDSEVGRFTSVDPSLDGVNHYVYVRNNPLKLVDPNGREVPRETLEKLAKMTIDEVVNSKMPAEFVDIKRSLDKAGGVDALLHNMQRVARDPEKVAQAAQALGTAAKKVDIKDFAVLITQLKGKTPAEKSQMFHNLAKNRPDLVNKLGEVFSTLGHHEELQLLRGAAGIEAKETMKVAQAAKLAAKAKPPGMMAMGGGGILNLIVGLFTGEVKVEDKPQTPEELAAKGSSQKIETFRASFYAVWGSDPAKHMTEEDKAKIDPQYKYQPGGA